MEKTEFRRLVLANAKRDKTTGFFKADDGSPVYLLRGDPVSKAEFDQASGLGHLSSLGFGEQDEAEEARMRALAEFVAWCGRNAAFIERGRQFGFELAVSPLVKDAIKQLPDRGLAECVNANLGDFKP